MNLSENNFPENRILYPINKAYIPIAIKFTLLTVVIGIVGYSLLLFILFIDPQFRQSPSFYLHKAVAIADISHLIVVGYCLLRDFYWMRNLYEWCMTDFLIDVTAFTICKLHQRLENRFHVFSTDTSVDLSMYTLLDRAIALLFPIHYKRLNKKRFVTWCIVFALVLSIFTHYSFNLLHNIFVKFKAIVLDGVAFCDNGYIK